MSRDIVQLSKKNGYGSDFYNTVSGDLKDLFPDLKSFSPTNLKYMRYFYELYPNALNRPQVVDDLDNYTRSSELIYKRHEFMLFAELRKRNWGKDLKIHDVILCDINVAKMLLKTVNMENGFNQF